jgi:hypothetical protein
VRVLAVQSKRLKIQFNSVCIGLSNIEQQTLKAIIKRDIMQPRVSVRYWLEESGRQVSSAESAALTHGVRCLYERAVRDQATVHRRMRVPDLNC